MASAMISPVKRKPFCSRSSIKVSPVVSGVVVRSGLSIEDDSGILVVIGAVVGGAVVVSGVVPNGPSPLVIGAVPFVTAGADVSANTAVVSEKRSMRRTRNESKRNPLALDMTIGPFMV